MSYYEVSATKRLWAERGRGVASGDFADVVRDTAPAQPNLTGPAYR